jgi:hypothetical protein
VGEAVILSAEGEGAAGIAVAVEVLAGLEEGWVGMVAITEALTGMGTGGAGLALLDDGAVARHGVSSWSAGVG